MSSILDKIVAASGAAQKVRVRVPEWDCDLYFSPLTPAERSRIRKGIKPDAIEAMFVSTIQHKARDAEGAPVFGLDPKTRDKMLAHADMTVIMRILREASIEDDPRRTMLEAASLDDLRNALAALGDAPAGEMSEMSDDMLEAVRALAMAREWEITDALGIDPAEGTDPIDAAKNA